jgi:hypothetical protein
MYVILGWDPVKDHASNHRRHDTSCKKEREKKSKYKTSDLWRASFVAIDIYHREILFAHFLIRATHALPHIY